MKKILIPVALAATLALASCGSSSSANYKVLREDVISSIDANIASLLNIDSLNTNSKKLYNITTTDESGNEVEKVRKGSYYDIYLNEDYANSLFTVNVDLKQEGALTSKTSSYLVSTLVFDNQWSFMTSSDNEQKSYIAELYNTKYGILTKTDDAYNYDFGLTLNANKNWNTKYAPTYLQKAAELEDLKLTIAYLPTYFVRTYKNEAILKAYVFVPVCVGLTSNGKQVALDDNKKITTVESKLCSIPSVTIATEDAKILKSESANI